VHDVLVEYDPLPEVGMNHGVFDEDGDRPLRDQELPDPRLRMPAWGEVPVSVSDGLQKGA
jgi:hypothetical protein